MANATQTPTSVLQIIFAAKLDQLGNLIEEHSAVNREKLLYIDAARALKRRISKREPQILRFFPKQARPYTSFSPQQPIAAPPTQQSAAANLRRNFPYVTKSKQSNPASDTSGSISYDANVKTRKLALVISKSANADDSWKNGSKQR